MNARQEELGEIMGKINMRLEEIKEKINARHEEIEAGINGFSVGIGEICV